MINECSKFSQNEEKVKKNVNPYSGCRERGCMVENRTCRKIQLYSETGNPCAGAVLRFFLAGTPVEEKNIAWKIKLRALGCQSYLSLSVLKPSTCKG
jgi:hypothetical protein